MAATVHKLFTVAELAPGVTYNFVWKNVPAGKAYAVDASPFYPVHQPGNDTTTTQAEVTRFSRRRRVIDIQGDLDIHNDVLGTVKNVGTDALHFDLYLTVFS